MNTIFKTLQIILLPNSQREHIEKGSILKGDDSKLLLSNIKIAKLVSSLRLHHLYILSPDEIFIGNWALNTITDKVVFVTEAGDYSHLLKIIASTEELKTNKEGYSVLKIPKSLITAYIKWYGKTKRITEVMVQYKEARMFEWNNKHIIDTDESGNTIIAKVIKQTYSRSEVEELCRLALAVKVTDPNQTEAWLQHNL